MTAHEYRDLMDVAAKENGFRHLVDSDHESFLRPSDMPTAIGDSAAGPALQLLKFASWVCAIESLAFKYRLVLDSLEQVTDQRIEQVRVIGGGSNTDSESTHRDAQTTSSGRTGEATALGNIGMQILATGGASSLEEVRAIIDRSFARRFLNLWIAMSWDRPAPPLAVSTIAIQRFKNLSRK